jgi:membrane protease YdiL (CAAX protease family)
VPDSSAFPLARSIPLIGWWHLLIFSVLLPARAIGRLRTYRADAPRPNRLWALRLGLANTVLVGAVSLLAALFARIELFRFDAHLLQQGLLASVAVYGASALGGYALRRRELAHGSLVAYLFSPETAEERAWCVVVSIAAGFFEEITWRGVQTALLAHLTGGYWTGAALSAGLFALVHISQGWRSTVLIVIIALGLQLVVSLSGTLYLAMVVHAATNLTGLYFYRRSVWALSPEQHS